MIKNIFIFIAKYLLNIFIGIFDQGLNTLLFGATDETISSRTGRAMLSGRPKWFVPPIYYSLNFIFRIIKKDINHSKESVEPICVIKNELWSWAKQEQV